jgi:hypothetical protein
LPADSEHVSRLSTPVQTASSFDGQATMQLPATQSMSASGLPPKFWSHSSPTVERHGLLGNEPVGKHAFSPPGSKQE